MIIDKIIASSPGDAIEELNDDIYCWRDGHLIS